MEFLQTSASFLVMQKEWDLCNFMVMLQISSLTQMTLSWGTVEALANNKKT